MYQQKRTLLDPIIVPFDQHVFDKGLIHMPASVSDHHAPYISLPFEYPLSTTFKRFIWLYNKGDYEALKTKFNNHDWNFISNLPINEVPILFEESFLKLVNECVPSKEITVRTDDKPWYDTEIKKILDIGIDSEKRQLSLKIHYTGKLTKQLVTKLII